MLSRHSSSPSLFHHKGISARASICTIVVVSSIPKKVFTEASQMVKSERKARVAGEKEEPVWPIETPLGSNAD